MSWPAQTRSKSAMPEATNYTASLNKRSSVTRPPQTQKATKKLKITMLGASKPEKQKTKV